MGHTGFGLAIGAMVLAIHTQAAGQMPPYHEEELTFANGAVTIACALTAPAGRGPFPAAVVLLSGSGAQNRDSELVGFRPFRGRLMEAISTGAGGDEIARHIRVLARMQLELLPEAQRKAMGDLDAVIEKMLPPQVAALRSRWFRFFVDFDPATALARVTCPVLAVFGERDLQVPPATNRPPLEAALAQGGNGQVTVKVYPEANHLFQASATGHPSEYATLPKVFVPAFLDDLAAWIAAR